MNKLRNMLSVACLALAMQPAFAQTITGTNLPNPLTITLSNGDSRAWVCYDSPQCNQINLANAQAEGFFIPQGYSKTQPPAIIVKHGANVESQVMIGVGAAAIVGVAAWLIWGRDRPHNIVTSSSTVGLRFNTN